MITEKILDVFPIGKTVLSENAQSKLDLPELYAALDRHARGDWGEVCPDCAKANDITLDRYFRVMSAYTSSKGVKFQLITEAHRLVTLVLVSDNP